MSNPIEKSKGPQRLWHGLVRTIRRYVLSGALFVVGFAFTIWLGVLTGAKKPPSTSQDVLLIVLAGVFQISGAASLYKVGRADPTLARAAVRRISQMAGNAHAARLIAEEALDCGDYGDIRDSMGKLSVHLSWLEEGLAEAGDDWAEFHAEALRGLRKDNNDRSN